MGNHKVPPKGAEDYHQYTRQPGATARHDVETSLAMEEGHHRPPPATRNHHGTFMGHRAAHGHTWNGPKGITASQPRPVHHPPKWTEHKEQLRPATRQKAGARERRVNDLSGRPRGEKETPNTV